MKINYVCTNKKCRSERKHPYVLTLELDDIMDEKNIAKMFCPHCKTPLEKGKKDSKCTAK